MSSTAPSPATAAITPGDLTPVAEDGEHEAEAEDFLLAAASFTIVGLRYYDGVAHRGEYINLLREPNNPYDRNAVRVDNVHGQKVGHIKATQALALAPIMDAANGRAAGMFGVTKVDGIIPRPAGTYSMPVRLEFYGADPSLAADLERFLERYWIAIDSSRRGRAAGAGAGASAGRDEKGVGGKSPPAVQSRTVVVRDWKSQAELDEMFDKQKSLLASVPPVAPPPQLTATLLPHQIAGLSWLQHRETFRHEPLFWKRAQEKGRSVWLSEITNASQSAEPRRVRGGLLCDEMGMGKSLMTLGLILSHPPDHHSYPVGEAEDEGGAADAEGATTDASAAHRTSSADIALKPPASMVAASPPPHTPTITAVKKLRVGQLRSIVSATISPSSNASVNDMKKAALVAACMDGLDSGKITNDSFWSIAIPSSAAAATAFSSSASAMPIAKAPPRLLSAGNVSTGCIATLIVCPVSVMSNWVEQVQMHVRPGVLRVEMYQGPDRYTVLPHVRSNMVDIVLVSYQTLAADFSAQFVGNGDKKAPKKRKTIDEVEHSIFSIPFHRIVLDEAHTIRNANTKVCSACLKLRSTNKLGLTGTPLQNKPEDLCPQLQFLGLEPFCERDVFRRAIAQPIRNGDDLGLARLRAVMCHVALRRTKDKEGIDLADKTVQICSITFPKGSVHETIYNTLFQSAQEAFGAILRDGEQEALKEYMSILETLLRIRQACCSGLLVPKGRLRRAEECLAELKKRTEDGGKPLNAAEGKKLLEKLKGVFGDGSDGGDGSLSAECAVCLEEFPQEHASILRTCSHVFCQRCIVRIASMHNHSCPLCRGVFEKSDVVRMSAASAAANAPDSAGSSDGGGTSSCLDSTDEELANSPKIAALLQSIGEMKADEKGVIFSQFTSFLDIIGRAMMAAGHSFTRIDGKKSAKARIKAMKEFNSDDEGSPRFILCSLLAAGAGINLTRGNHAFLTDLWWNKSVEDQAMDRVHRIGQKRKVRVVKFVMEGSVEERIIKMQEAKAAMGKGTMEKLSPEEMRKARISALKDLFQIASSDEACLA